MNVALFSDIFQRFTEHGIAFPFVNSGDDCRKNWQSEQNTAEIHGNRPVDYATKNPEIIEYLVKNVRSFATADATILEIGCNAGSNLNGLYQHGYRNLFGIEINPYAIEQMKASFPDAYVHSRIMCGDAVDSLKEMESQSIDVIFTMAVLFHIHPSENGVFDEMVRVAKKNILVIENETYLAKHIFPRNYQRVFENRGCKQVFSEPLPFKGGYERFIIRLFSLPVRDKTTMLQQR